ncbi:MAG TPA: hypothetical protein DCP90_00970 [Clostridiales bacterium]|nr:MAG: hypothetical protein A2Y22_07775 [Clostridiales bacterium GWD2_32_59]HAN09168.1 hypothetical protein [Clostridiales bacterium]
MTGALAREYILNLKETEDDIHEEPEEGNQTIEEEKAIRLKNKEDQQSLKLKLLDNGYNKKYMELYEIFIDTNNGELYKSGCKVRIRVNPETESVEITYKSKKITYGIGIRKREEINVEVPIDELNQHIDNFNKLGYEVSYSLLKFREEYKKDNTVVTFDKWPIIKESIEIEIRSTEVSNEMTEFESQFLDGIEYQVIKGRYGDSIKEVMNETGKTFEELTVEFREETGFDLGNICKYVEIPETDCTLNTN